MKRLAPILALISILLPLTESASARVPRVTVRHAHHRTTVVVHRSFPLRRRLPMVVVRPARTTVVVTPAAYLAPVVWTATVVTLPQRERLVCEDSETLNKDEGWTDFTLGANDQGTRLYLEIVGKAQLNFAEVVFENGETRVVDFNEKTRGPGVHSLLDFPDGRRVSHVRMVARSKSDEARIVLRLEN
jgi:hypothetical protein